MHEENPYEQQRQAVIELSNRYIKNRDTFIKYCNTDDGLDEAGVKDILAEVKKLEENKYLLAIVGESKSGKSTFINAFLEKPILPTDMLQCTSGIIEIVDTEGLQTEEKVYLKITYGDQPKYSKVEYSASLVNDTKPLQDKLQNIAALGKDYRSLPIHQLNQFLLNKKLSGITNALVEEFCGDILKESGNNPDNLEKEEFARRVKSYMEEYRDLTKIPVEIKVGYPIGLKFAHIQLIDTPGVNAQGGLETITINTIGEANAVIFVHSLKNIDSKSLRQFFEGSVYKKSYGNIFMFLTHRAYENKEDVEKVLERAKTIYSDIRKGDKQEKVGIKPERIIAVDSMLKQMSHALKSGISVETLLKEEKQEQLGSKYDRRYKGDAEKIASALLEDSNFDAAKKLLTDFSATALIEQLRYVVQQVAGGYKEQQNVYGEHIRLIGWKDEYSKTSDKFDNEIEKLKELLEQYKKRLNFFSEETQPKKYKGLHSDMGKKFSEMKAVYNKLLGNNIDNEDQLRKHIMDFNDECDAWVTRFTTNLVKEYEAAMDDIGGELKREHQIDPPKINLESISKEAKEQAYETITIPGDRKQRVIGGLLGGGVLGTIIGLGTIAVAGPVVALAVAGAALGGATEYFNGTATKQESRFNDKKYKELMINDAKNLVISITEKMPQVISNSFDAYNKQFSDRMEAIISQRQNAYDQLKKDKEEAEKRRQLESGRNEVDGELKKIEAITKQLPKKVEEASKST